MAAFNASSDGEIAGGDLQNDRAVENQAFAESVYTLLEKEQFDTAIKTITCIRGDRRLRRKIIRDYLIRLSGYLERLKPDLILPSGWLRDESTDFSGRIKSSFSFLGEDFIFAFVQLCAAPEFTHERYLIHVFLEICLDGYLWTDMVELCLLMAAKDQKSDSSAKYRLMSQKLCNVRQIVSQSPNGSMPNPFFDGVAEDDVSDSYLRQRGGEILFPPGKPLIFLADLEKEIAISIASSALPPGGKEEGEEDSLAFRLFKKTEEMKLFRETLLLSKFCGISKSFSVFKKMTNWVILVSTLAVDHWDNYLNEVGKFLDRMDIPDAEKIYQKGQESAEVYIERTLDLIEGALVDLYLELGTPTDLKAIITCYASAQRLPFPRLNRIILNPRNFSDILWHFLELDEQHFMISHYITEWVNGVSGRESAATAPVFSLTDSEDRIELGCISHNLFCALKNYFAAGDSQVQMMWSSLDAALQSVNEDGKYFQPNERLVVSYSEPADQLDQDMDSDDGRQSD